MRTALLLSFFLSLSACPVLAAENSVDGKLAVIMAEQKPHDHQTAVTRPQRLQLLATRSEDAQRLVGIA